jgi:peptide/nickel transport system substrate-binding protein
MKRRLSTAVSLLAVLASAPALAQKAKDTVRIPIGEPISGLSYYLNPNSETDFNASAVHDTLIVFDEKEAKFAPLLAKSWKRIDDRTLEMDLRDDVAWHDGETFDADDVQHTLEWAAHPEVKLRNKHFFEWVEKVEKLGSHKVRIIAQQPAPFGEAILSAHLHILPEHLHAKLPLNDKLAFARKPVGTGMFRAAEVNDAKGIFLVKNDAYKHGGTAKPAGNVKYLSQPFMPDFSSRIAEFLAGNVEVLARQLSVDQMEDLAKQPGVKMSMVQGPTVVYMALDARGRAGVQALTDARVRKAMFMAIDRAELVKLVAGEFTLNRVPEGICWKDQAGCDYSVSLPAFDPAGAKKLLAEAGYPSGFDVELATYATSVADVAVAVSGQLSKVGIRSTVQKYSIATLRKVESDGKVAVFIGSYPSGNIPDASNTLSYFFDPPAASDYHGDAELRAMAKRLEGVMDPAKRKELARPVYDRATEQAYFGAIAPRPVVIVHRDSVEVRSSRYANVGFKPGDVNWK